MYGSKFLGKGVVNQAIDFLGFQGGWFFYHVNGVHN